MRRDKISEKDHTQRKEGRLGRCSYLEEEREKPEGEAQNAELERGGVQPD